MTPKHLFVSSLLALPLAALPLAAAAQEARTVKWVNVRAGPDRDYPLVVRYGPNTPITVQGCTDGYGWCDVVGPDGTRGWLYAGNINYAYQNSYVPVLNYGPQIGLPIVTFVIGSYWGSYYRNRPFYNSIPRWEHHRPPPRPSYGGPPRPRPPGYDRPGRPDRPGFDRPDRPGNGRPDPGFRPPGGGNRPDPGVRPPGGGNRPDPGVRPPGGGGNRPGPNPGGPRLPDEVRVPGGPGGPRPGRPDNAPPPQPR